MADELRFDPDNEAASLGADEEYETRVSEALRNMELPPGNYRELRKHLGAGWRFERTPSGLLRIVWKEAKA